MIKLNLIKHNLPEKIDIPEKYKKTKKIALGVALALIAIFLIIGSYQTLKLFKKVKKIPIVKPKIEKHIVKKKAIIPKHKPSKHAKTQKTQPEENKKSKKEQKTKKEEVEKLIKKSESAPIFSIEVAFTTIPKKPEPDNTTKLLPPLPAQFTIKQPKPKPKQKPLPIYAVTIKTSNPSVAIRILKSNKIEYKLSKKAIIKGFVYDVYVGGLTSYNATLKFAKALKARGYNVYAITNINLLYYCLIDKSIDSRKKIAYKKAWSKTVFKIIFKAKPKKSFIWYIRFSTPSKAIIKTLKKYGYYPIIKTVKNGA